MALSPILQRLLAHIADTRKHGDLTAHDASASAHDGRFSGVNAAINDLRATDQYLNNTLSGQAGQLTGLTNSVAGLSNMIGSMGATRAVSGAITTEQLVAEGPRGTTWVQTLPAVSANNVYFWVLYRKIVDEQGEGIQHIYYTFTTGTTNRVAIEDSYYAPRDFTGGYIVIGWS